MKIEYMEHGDVLIPNLTVMPEDEVQLGKYGLMRRQFLKEHRPILFNQYLSTQTLNHHLLEIESIAKQRKNKLMDQFKIRDSISEDLKANDPILWAQKMNQIETEIDEILKSELIFH
ncbi:MAG TPA: TnpV protein [Candidatus Merdibacter merdavium]|uniref:TnpV protein n=1 Tax=Candidatus Merdibacter merdavium TaxID=2838692 RepID=A0A9D2NRA9_9FIRM|nr:TnpV protein [Candidatus Merdibacter merdavium]